MSNQFFNNLDSFAPVHPEMGDRAMLTMTRTEAIHYVSMQASGRPILYNAAASNDMHPERHRTQLKWFESCVERDIRYPQTAALEVGFALGYQMAARTRVKLTSSRQEGHTPEGVSRRSSASSTGAH